MNGFESLLKSSGVDVHTRWYPKNVDLYRDSLKVGNMKEKSNFAYSMQHLEYMELQLEFLNLSEVIERILYKTFIVTGIGIIEMIFHNLIKDSKKLKNTKWNTIKQYESVPVMNDTIKTKVRTLILEEVDEFNTNMKFGSMIDLVKKNKLISIHSNSYESLEKLRDLRNKVHLQVDPTNEDHDYNSFFKEDFNTMKLNLYGVLRDPKVTPEKDKHLYEFIKPVNKPKLKQLLK